MPFAALSATQFRGIMGTSAPRFPPTWHDSGIDCASVFGTGALASGWTPHYSMARALCFVLPENIPTVRYARVHNLWQCKPPLVTMRLCRTILCTASLSPAHRCFPIHACLINSFAGIWSRNILEPGKQPPPAVRTCRYSPFPRFQQHKM